MLEALADRLTSASIATNAVNLFIGLMPATPDLCVALYEYAGERPLEVFQDNAETVDMPSVQVLVRGARNDYPTARALAISVRDNLVGISNQTVGSVRFLRVNEITSINAIGSDDNDRPRFTLSLRAVIER